MLQINTGKLFSSNHVFENQLKGILYSNMKLELLGPGLQGPLFGTLFSSSELNRSPQTLIYEFTEKIEGSASEPRVLLSHGADPYLEDMATLISFGLKCICHPDIDLVRRLISGQKGLVTMQAPSAYVQNIFDETLYLQPTEEEPFIAFINQVLGLHRRTYLGVMRAIRTYVTGLHRVADDLELAYTLMVASVESLAQDFDGHIPDWNSLADNKRAAFDRALTSAPESIAKEVRDTVLNFEHTSLARRFQKFVLKYTTAEFFRGPFEKDSQPIGRSYLPEVLKAAYQARSQYIHTLRKLPSEVTHSHGFSETALVERERMLTLQGLSRLMRHVIMEFVQQEPTLERETYDYSLERHGVIQVRLAPKYWLANTKGDISRYGKLKLEGFLNELALYYEQSPGATVTNLNEVLTNVVMQFSSMKKDERRPYLALLVLFNREAKAQAVLYPPSVNDLINKELVELSSEALIVHAILDKAVHWSIEEHAQVILEYKRKRPKKSGIHFPKMFEAAISLELAERYRLAGQIEQSQQTMVEAADDYPEHEALRTAIATSENNISWRAILIPERCATSL